MIAILYRFLSEYATELMSPMIKKYCACGDIRTSLLMIAIFKGYQCEFAIVFDKLWFSVGFRHTENVDMLRQCEFSIVIDQIYVSVD